MTMIKQCDYEGCGKPIADGQDQRQGLRFCAAHDREFTALAEDNDVKGMLRFWVKSHGGAAKFAKECADDLLGRQR